MWQRTNPRISQKIIAITLPADFESCAFSGEGDVGCFQTELCCLLSGSKKVYPRFITSNYFSERLIAFCRVSLLEFFASLYPHPLLLRLEKTGYPPSTNPPHTQVFSQNFLSRFITNVEGFLNVTNSNSSVFRF